MASQARTAWKQVSVAFVAKFEVCSLSRADLSRRNFFLAYLWLLVRMLLLDLFDPMPVSLSPFLYVN